MDKKQQKKNKYSKIDQEEWIQMEDLNIPKNQNLSRKFAQDQGIKFERKDYSQIQHEKQRPEKISNIQFNQTQQKLLNNNLKIQNRKPPPLKQKPSVPMMEVTCDFCTLIQQVPGNTQLYICGSCQNLSQCYPLYGVFVCGCCQSKVCYGFGINQLIRCTKCNTVNQVPIEPTKKYMTEDIEKREVRRRTIIQKNKVQKSYQQNEMFQERQKQNCLREKDLHEIDFKYDDF